MNINMYRNTNRNTFNNKKIQNDKQSKQHHLHRYTKRYLNELKWDSKETTSRRLEKNWRPSNDRKMYNRNEPKTFQLYPRNTMYTRTTKKLIGIREQNHGWKLCSRRNCRSNPTSPYCTQTTVFCITKRTKGTIKTKGK